MSKDIGPILEGWPYEPGQVTVRKVRGDDGRVKIQLRVDLGLLQMESRGRPDGQRPYDCDSLLDYCLGLLERHRRTHGADEGFSLDDKLCDQLRAEAVQYYYRYLSEFVLEEYDAVVRDTARNLAVLELCARHAREQADRIVMEQYRPYILMMNARARAMLTLAAGKPRQARKIVEQALGKLREFFSSFSQEGAFEGSTEAAGLRGLLEEIEAKTPGDPVARLHKELAQALKQERYEEAARLRDAIRHARDAEKDEPDPEQSS